MLEPLGQHPERQRLDLGSRLIGGGPVGYNARKSNDFREPTSVIFLLDFDLERHPVPTVDAPF
jgi:hypothetical protein